jgi:NMD protein affecting ribosome stability and mRNA decay
MNCPHEGNRAAGMLKGFCQVCDPEGFKAEWERILENQKKRACDQCGATSQTVKVSPPEGDTLSLCNECYQQFKRGRMFGEEVELERCENCGNNHKVKGGSCLQCGHSFRVGR